MRTGARMCACVSELLLLLLYIIVVYYGARTVPVVALYACARGALRILYADGKGTVADTRYTERSCARQLAFVGSTLCTHILSSLIGGGQRVPILNIRSCSSLSAIHPLQYNTITRRSSLLLFVTAIVFCPSVRLRVQRVCVCSVHCAFNKPS